ncbi:hypothetical protein [Jannaschia sp. 2305UL9-9]|uniref:hypothetical protein n=1 Tax=Jannaschia sp. 2305UL9-9 TaxID=3121638 RepID=UPI00352872F3
MRRHLAVAMAVTLATAPAIAAPNAQLVASVQNRLDRLGFDAVDADSLTTRQIAALHMQLQGRALSFGPGWIKTRQRVQVILGWDDPDA